jgi:hypothetical protein
MPTRTLNDPAAAQPGVKSVGGCEVEPICSTNTRGPPSVE